MADYTLNTPYVPGQTLIDMYQAGPEFGAMADKINSAAMQNQQIIQQQTQAMNPLLQQYQAAQNRREQALAGNTEAAIPGTQAESGLKQLQLKSENMSFDDKVNALKSHIKTQMSDDEVAQLGNRASTWATAAAEAKAYGGTLPLEAQQRYAKYPEVMRALSKPGGMDQLGKAAAGIMDASSARQAERQKQQADYARSVEVANIGANSRETVARIQKEAKLAHLNSDYLAFKSMAGKTPDEQAGGYQIAAMIAGNKAAQDKDPEAKTAHQEMAKFYMSQVKYLHAQSITEKRAAAAEVNTAKAKLQELGIAANEPDVAPEAPTVPGLGGGGVLKRNPGESIEAYQQRAAQAKQ